MQNNFLVSAVMACGVATGSFAAGQTNDVSQVTEETAGVEEKSKEIFKVGFGFDFFSAYVWRNAISTDEMVMQPCVWGDLTYFEPLWLGFSIWQNYDLTDRRGNQFKYGLNETDYNVHLGATAWESADEAYSVSAEIGHDWYTYHGVRDGVVYPDLRELYAKVDFANPFVGVYGKTAWMYEDFDGTGPAMHYEFGFNKEMTFSDIFSSENEFLSRWTVGADWNLNFGDHRYLAFLYGEDSNGGIGGTTVKVYLTWQITDWMSLGGVVAYTGVLNSGIRDAIGGDGEDYGFAGNSQAGYPRDLCWGGLQLKISY